MACETDLNLVALMQTGGAEGGHSSDGVAQQPPSGIKSEPQKRINQNA